MHPSLQKDGNRYCLSLQQVQQRYLFGAEVQRLVTISVIPNATQRLILSFAAAV